MSNPSGLFHYTSLDTLALILASKKLRFSSLLHVDDTDEAEAADIKHFGKYIYVSCWTDEENESIPMWQLYTPQMHGVRIKMPKFPFVKYQYKAGEYFFSEDAESFINYQALYDENVGSITANFPTLLPVNYSNDSRLLYPNVRRGDTQEEYQKTLGLKNGTAKPHSSITYKFSDLGIYKRKDWSFQKEWRYRLFISPLGMRDYDKSTFKTHADFARRLEDVAADPPYSSYMMNLSNEAISQMEIVLGPRAEKILAKALLAEHGLCNNWRESKLHIR